MTLIKSLSLFFIDEVSKYRQYDADGNEVLGEYGQMFEQEYLNVLNDYITIFDTPYQKYLKSTCSDVSAVHKGYFSIDKKTGKKGFKKYIGDAALSDVSRILLTKYSNVKLSVYVDDDGFSHLKVEVKKLFGGGVLDFLLTQRRKANRKTILLSGLTGLKNLMRYCKRR